MPDPPGESAELPDQLATAFVQVEELLAPIDNVVARYRDRLESAGWSPDAAESMAVEFHRALWAQVRADLRSPDPSVTTIRETR